MGYSPQGEPRQVEIVSVAGKVADIDDISSDFVTIDTEHHNIHDGIHYTIDDYAATVNIATPKNWLFKAPNTSTRIHIFFRGEASQSGLWEFFEAPTTTANGTPLTAQNNDRNSPNAATLSVFKDPTVTVTGTRIFVTVVPATGTNQSRPGGINERRNELILKQGASYLLKFTAGVDATAVTIDVPWYEL